MNKWPVGQPVQVQSLEFVFPAIINDVENSNHRLSPYSMLNAWYVVECVSPFDSVVDLTLEDTTMHVNYFSSFDFVEVPTEEIEIDDSGLRLYVDIETDLSMTKSPIWARYLFHHYLGDQVLELEDDSTFEEVKSFPIYLVNLGEHTASINAQDGSLIMQMEAKTDSTTWELVEYWSPSWCGNSYHEIRIPSGNAAFMRGIKYSGEINTVGRLRLQNGDSTIFSNEFPISVNQGQFEMPDLDD